MNVKERFLKYISVDTTSDPSSTTFPSTKSQLDFAASLVKEMKEMGLIDVSCDENGYVFGTIPATIENYQACTGIYFSYGHSSRLFWSKHLSPHN